MYRLGLLLLSVDGNAPEVGLVLEPQQEQQEQQALMVVRIQ